MYSMPDQIPAAHRRTQPHRDQSHTRRLNHAAPRVMLGLPRDNGKGNHYNIGVVFGLHRENAKENGHFCNIGVVFGLHRENAKENEHFCNIGVVFGLYRDNGKENGNYYVREVRKPRSETSSFAARL